MVNNTKTDLPSGTGSVIRPLTLVEDASNGLHDSPVDTEIPKYTIPKWRKYAETSVLYAVFFMLGEVFGILGPSILDLQIATHTDTATITRAFIGRSLGTILGAGLSGIILGKVDRHLAMGSSVFLMAVLLAIIPWTWHVAVMGIVLALCATSRGFANAAGNACLLIVWENDNGPWLQALHFTGAVGSMAGPLLVQPFLTEDEDILDSTTTVPLLSRTEGIAINSTDNWPLGHIGNNGTSICDGVIRTSKCMEKMPIMKATTNIWIPFLISGIPGILISLCFVVLFFTKSPFTLNKKGDNIDKSHICYNEKKGLRIILLIIMMMFIINQTATQFGYQTYVFAYVVKHLHWSKENAALLTAAVYAAFAVGRAAGIFFIKIMKPSTLLLLDSTTLVLSIAPLVFFADYHVVVVWLCSIGNGWSIARLFATGITWLDNYIQISGVGTAAYVIAGSVGDMIGPLILTALYNTYGLGSFPVIFFCTSLLTFSLCIAMLYVATRHGKRIQKESASSELSERENFNPRN